MCFPFTQSIPGLDQRQSFRMRQESGDAGWLVSAETAWVNSHGAFINVRLAAIWLKEESKTSENTWSNTWFLTELKVCMYIRRLIANVSSHHHSHLERAFSWFNICTHFIWWVCVCLCVVEKESAISHCPTAACCLLVEVWRARALNRRLKAVYTLE